MALILSAETYIVAQGYGNEHTSVRVTTDAAAPAWLKTGFEEREYIYRAEDGDTATFFYYKEPGSGFGGCVVKVQMKNGSERKLIGPWSSNAPAVNKFFPDRDALFTCVDQFNCVIHVKIKALQRLGIEFKDGQVWQS